MKSCIILLDEMYEIMINKIGSWDFASIQNLGSASPGIFGLSNIPIKSASKDQFRTLRSPKEEPTQRRIPLEGLN